jgi:hypothetical protein
MIQGDLPFFGRDDLDDTRGHSPRFYALHVFLKVFEFMISWLEDWNPSSCIWIILGWRLRVTFCSCEPQKWSGCGMYSGGGVSESERLLISSNECSFQRTLPLFEQDLELVLNVETTNKKILKLQTPLYLSIYRLGLLCWVKRRDIFSKLAKHGKMAKYDSNALIIMQTNYA